MITSSNHKSHVCFSLDSQCKARELAGLSCFVLCGINRSCFSHTCFSMYREIGGRWPISVCLALNIVGLGERGCLMCLCVCIHSLR